MTPPINSKTVSQPTQTKTQQPAVQAKPKTVKIGGVEYKANQVESSEKYTQNGQTRYNVFVKPGVQLDYPAQTDKSKSPRVESLGLYEEWYNRDDSHINIYDIDNATITGKKNKDDYIRLAGRSSNNTVIVDQKESWYINGDMRRDCISLDPETSNNTVKMDEKDRLQIMYNSYNDKQTGLDILTITGKGTSEQEVQLKHDVGNHMYNYHKSQQQK